MSADLRRLSVLGELESRLMNAAANLIDLAYPPHDETARLVAKAQGVQLALEYVRDSMAQAMR